MVKKINILDELKEAGAITLIELDNKNCFFVPDDYFNTLSSNILAEVFIQSLPTQNPYTVPGSYFKDFPEIILEKINIRRDLQVSGIDEKNLYAVPEDYFNSFSDNILKKIKSSNNPVQQELEEISPILSKIPKTNVYSVSANYFEGLDPLIVTNENNSVPQVKVIPINRTRKWMIYAAAACIAAVLFGSGYFYFFNSKPQDSTISNLAKMDVQQEISVLSDDEILNYLRDNNNMAVYTSTGNEDAPQQNTNMQILLLNISDEEIEEYLNDEPEVRKIEGI